jgi:hypothetical protein
VKVSVVALRHVCCCPGAIRDRPGCHRRVHKTRVFNPMFHSNLLNLFSLQGLSVSMSAIGRLANMQTEQQIDSPALPKVAPQADSGESKDKHGGKRPGAGRKPNLAKILLKGVSRTTILAAVENVDVGAIIIGLLKSKREQTRLEALHFVFDRVIGKPKQDLNFSGGIVHTHTRDPILAALPKEALEALAQSYNEIIGKYATPVLHVAQDGPQNQIESMPDTKTVQVESEKPRVSENTPGDAQMTRDRYSHGWQCGSGSCSKGDRLNLRPFTTCLTTCGRKTGSLARPINSPNTPNIHSRGLGMTLSSRNSCGALTKATEPAMLRKKRRSRGVCSPARTALLRQSILLRLRFLFCRELRQDAKEECSRDRQETPAVAVRVSGVRCGIKPRQTNHGKEHCRGGPLYPERRELRMELRKLH